MLNVMAKSKFGPVIFKRQLDGEKGDKATVKNNQYRLTREKYVELLTEKVFSAINAEQTIGRKRTAINNLKENVRPQAMIDNTAVLAAGTSDGLSIHIT